MIKNPNSMKKWLGLNPPFKYISLIKNIFTSKSKTESCREERNKNIVIVKVCFPSHVNVRKYYLPYGVVSKCCFVSKYFLKKS